MFKNNKYTKIYYSIIEKAKLRTLNGYFESHHIIPKCIGGSDSKNNLVKLTPKEHFVCHHLLTKMNDNIKLKQAFIIMHVKNPYQANRHVPSASSYDYAKRLNAEISAIKMKGISYNKGKNKYYNSITLEEVFSYEGLPYPWIKGSLKARNPKNKGKVYFYNPKTMQVKSFDSCEQAPVGWLKGNPNAKTAVLKANLQGSTYFHCPVTLEEKRLKKCPDGWLKGRIFIVINDGIVNKNHTKYLDMPNGWVKGAINKKSKKREDFISTSLGTFTHRLRFCEKYKLDVSVLSNLDTKFNKKRMPLQLYIDLVEAGYDFNKSKKENGFYYLKEKQ